MKKSLICKLTAVFLLVACAGNKKTNTMTGGSPVQKENITSVSLDIGNYKSALSEVIVQGDVISLSDGDWLSYEIDIPESGRYTVEITAKGASSGGIWIEDYIHNPDDRTYNVTGFVPNSESGMSTVDGSPLKAGKHDIKVHAQGGKVQLSDISFTMLQKAVSTPDTLVQNMIGTEWKLVWSDEFDGAGLPDSTKWMYNVGNWGWGNNEPQYYTNGRIENARQEEGALVIEARKNDMGQDWTSARLTTQGKTTFTYGKIEFRAKVPVGRGTWAAGWLLGDAYEDEISWPYCGEIDVLECVGYEINDTTGDGLNHASCHTRAYYFKQGNHLTATTEVENMNDEWHTYGIEWYPDSVRAYVDDVFYYTYDKTANELEWPFSNPQNIILNLAVGGGWGGAKGIDENWNSHKFLVDYVRVYEAVNASEKKR